MVTNLLPNCRGGSVAEQLQPILERMTADALTTAARHLITMLASITVNIGVATLFPVVWSLCFVEICGDSDPR
jgi:hypothetical protein